MAYRFSFLVLFLFVFASAGFAGEQKAVRFIVPDNVLAQWGYVSKGFEKSKQLAWETETFGSAAVYRQKIKARKSVKGQRGVYFRFSFLREDYPSVEAAEKRGMKLRYSPEGFNSKMRPEYILRDGFVVGDKVYIVATDVMFMRSDKRGLLRVLDLLRRYVGS